jgi:O-acetyl-ADP-ribose deacetylase (regulator of RNase III)
MQLINKDITTLESGIILHVCNNQGVMGTGVAKALYTKWPAVKTAYQKQGRWPLGLNIYVEQEDIIIVDMIAQDGFGKEPKVYLDYPALRACLSDIQQMGKLISFVPIYIPWHMGCGLAGGDWNEVLKIIEEFLPYAIICKLGG